VALVRSLAIRIEIGLTEFRARTVELGETGHHVTD